MLFYKMPKFTKISSLIDVLLFDFYWYCNKWQSGLFLEWFNKEIMIWLKHPSYHFNIRNWFFSHHLPSILITKFVRSEHPTFLKQFKCFHFPTKLFFSLFIVLCTRWLAQIVGDFIAVSYWTYNLESSFSCFFLMTEQELFSPFQETFSLACS